MQVQFALHEPAQSRVRKKLVLAWSTAILRRRFVGGPRQVAAVRIGVPVDLPLDRRGYAVEFAGDLTDRTAEMSQVRDLQRSANDRYRPDGGFAARRARLRRAASRMLVPVLRCIPRILLAEVLDSPCLRSSQYRVSRTAFRS